MSLKKHIKDLIPQSILFPLQKLHGKIWRFSQLKREKKMIERQPALHEQALEKIRAEGKRPINVVFFALMDSVWKYDMLYRIMENDPRFHPTILICPIVNYGRDNMLLNMENCYNLFRSRGYNVIKSYNPSTDEFIDVRTSLNPDVIFYTNPYEGLIDDRYFIKKFTDILTCYTEYGFIESRGYDQVYNGLLQNLVWKNYVGFPYQIEKSQIYSRNKGRNVVCSGLPGIDRMIEPRNNINDCWKIKDDNIKRIIWAPHHTITDYVSVYYSTFLDYCQFMVELAKNFLNEIQIAFKPHPLLKNRLELLWGKERTNDYYRKWDEMPNGMLFDGAYEDLFITSDAIIHDSGSFIGEYLYTNKPAMFLSNGTEFSTQYNDFTVKCLQQYYVGKSPKDIEDFVSNIINGIDPLKKDREKFIKDELMPPKGKYASENIMNDLVKELC